MSSLAEDARARDEQVRAGFAGLGRVVGADSAVHLHVDAIGQQLAQALRLGNGLGHERLPRIARVDAHAEDEVDELAGDRDDVVRLGLRVEGDADSELELARLPDHARKVVAGLVVHGDAVAARLGDLPESASPGCSTMRWQSSTPPSRWTIGEIDLSTIGPIVIGSTKCPSPTSKWKIRAPASMSVSICSPSREKSAA